MKAIWKVRVGSNIKFFRTNPFYNREDVYCLAYARFSDSITVISRERFERC